MTAPLRMHARFLALAALCGAWTLDGKLATLRAAVDAAPRAVSRPEEECKQLRARDGLVGPGYQVPGTAYTLGKCVGDGSFMSVWSVEGSPELVLKVTPPETPELFTLEQHCDFAKRAARKAGMNFVKCQNTGTFEGAGGPIRWIVFERAPGELLDAVLRGPSRFSELSLDRVVQIEAQLYQMQVALWAPDQDGIRQGLLDYTPENLHVVLSGGQARLIAFDYNFAFTCCAARYPCEQWERTGPWDGLVVCEETTTEVLFAPYNVGALAALYFSLVGPLTYDTSLNGRWPLNCAPANATYTALNGHKRIRSAAKGRVSMACFPLLAGSTTEDGGDCIEAITALCFPASQLVESCSHLDELLLPAFAFPVLHYTMGPEPVQVMMSSAMGFMCGVNSLRDAEEDAAAFVDPHYRAAWAAQGLPAFKALLLAMHDTGPYNGSAWPPPKLAAFFAPEIDELT